MKEIYLISGLGADHRLFKNQELEGIPVKVLPWIDPHRHESLESYAQRMCSYLPSDTRDVVLGGVSFGGIMAIEMSKQIPLEKIILISSIKTSDELPWRIKFWKYLPVYRLVSTANIGRAGLLSRWLFGIMTHGETQLFSEMVKATSPRFMKWAIDKIVHWNNSFIPPATVQIHGTRDLIFPLYNVKGPVMKIEGGTHIMVLSRAGEINTILKKELE